MYSVIRFSHPDHGPVIHIKMDMNGSERTPFQAVQSACKERRLWMESGIRRVRILIDHQVMTVKQAEHWAIEEYKIIPKCFGCAKPLNEDVITHQLRSELFCSQECADKDYNEQIENLKDEIEIDYL